MPGRQAHGRSLTQQPSKPKNRGKASKARSQTNALNAFGIAQEHFPSKEKKTPRFRGLDAEFERKHARDEDDDDEGDEDDEEEQPRRKRARPTDAVEEDFGSDSEGNEWRLGGLMDDDEDSEIESDDAFGDSDNEKFDEYTFRGSKAKSKKPNDSESEDDEGDSDDEEGETLGNEAIDLATALDQWDEESEDEPKEGSGSDSDESGSAESDDDEDEDSDSEDGDEPDADKLEALQGLVSGFGSKHDQKQQAPAKQKIDLGDLGLNGIDDPFMKNSVKLMNKESKEKRPGASKKLDIPLSRREQGRLDRSAAYEKTNETLARWNDTVKQNRRAEHLSFPLAPDSGKAGLDKTTFQPIKPQPSANDHEANILSILDQAGLTEQPKKEKEKIYDDDGNELTRKEIIAKKRLEREMNDREAKRAARVKKIKSKAYHRVHRKQRERDAAALEEAEGDADSEAEREAQDRRRALERVGQRHKESKWAKMGARNKRAVWDDEFRAGLGEMARKDEELRRRKEGKAIDSDDETSSSGSDSEEGGNNLLRQINQALEEEDDAPQKGLMGMKFMRNAENAKRKMEREELEQMKKELEEEAGIYHGEEGDQEVGRRTYGGMPTMNGLEASARPDDASASGDELDTQPTASKRRAQEARPTPNGNKWSKSQGTKSTPREILSVPRDQPDTTHESHGAWVASDSHRRSKTKTADIDPTITNLKRTKPKPKKPTTSSYPGNADGNASDDSDSHMPLAIRDQELIDRTFAGDDVLAEFEAEKNEVAEKDDDKVIDNTLPGWGSWVGDGVSARDQKRNQGRYMTKVEGIKKKNRKDAKLDRVIINEKRNKKVSLSSPFSLFRRGQYANQPTERPIPRNSITSSL